MSKKYEKKMQGIKTKKEEHKYDKEKKSSHIDIRNIKDQSVKKQKNDLKNIKKIMDRSNKIW